MERAHQARCKNSKSTRSSPGLSFLVNPNTSTSSSRGVTEMSGDQWLADLSVREEYGGNQSKLEQSTIDTWKDGGEIVREKGTCAHVW